MLGIYLFCIYVAVLSVFAGSRPRSPEKWWVEIVTDLPRCTYYFGPFDTDKEASSNIPGYVEDLESEEPKELASASNGVSLRNSRFATVNSQRVSRLNHVDTPDCKNRVF